MLKIQTTRTATMPMIAGQLRPKPTELAACCPVVQVRSGKKAVTSRVPTISPLIERTTVHPIQ
jgi:hypothetical protein